MNANEGNLETAEGGTPTPALPGNSQPSSESDLTKVLSRLDAIDKKQAELDASQRAIQSDKDKGVKKVQADVERINKVLAMKEKGLDQDEILHRLRVEELYDRQTPEPVVQLPAAAGRADTYLDEAQRFVQESGLDPADPEVVKLMIGRAHEADYLRLAVRKLKAPTPEGAGAQPMRPEGAVKQDMDALANSYVKEVNKVRGNKAAIRAIQAQYQEKGLDTSRIDPLGR